MKIFAFLMAVMVLALSFMPCMDDAYTFNSKNAKCEFSKPGQQKDHNEKDACSPFCSCNCCTGFTLQFNPYQTDYTILFSAKKPNFHLPSKISDIALPVWQPPQLV